MSRDGDTNRPLAPTFLAERGLVDARTGVTSHAGAKAALAIALADSVRSKDTLSVLMVCLDGPIDAPAPTVASRIEVARRLRTCIRDTDLLAHWTDYEFVAILPQTEENGAAVVAERMRVAIANKPFFIAGGSTASIGITDTTHRGDLPKMASAARYLAVREGGNQVQRYVPVATEWKA